MKRFKVFAERVIVEEAEVEADSVEQAYDIAAELDNSAWTTSHDADWQITSVQEFNGGKSK